MYNFGIGTPCHRFHSPMIIIQISKSHPEKNIGKLDLMQAISKRKRKRYTRGYPYHFPGPGLDPSIVQH
jgi:hypothetical protein